MKTLEGTVRAIRGNTIEVESGGDLYRCRFRGKAKRERSVSDKLAAVGDRVEILTLAAGEGSIQQVLPRKNHLSRPDSYSRSREQVIVANVDALMVVHSVVQPDLDRLTIDKCFVMAASCGIPPALTVTKTDLSPAPDLRAYRQHYPIFAVSSSTGAGIEELRSFLDGKTTVLLGPSGVGKSTLLNALLPSLDLKTGEVSEKTGEGRHTTSWVEIVPVGGARVVDTPGLEFFDFWNLTLDRLPTLFPEFEGGTCQYRNCGHEEDRGCRVREGVEAGEIDRVRYENYREIRRVLREKGVAFSAPVRRIPGKKSGPKSIAESADSVEF